MRVGGIDRDHGAWLIARNDLRETVVHRGEDTERVPKIALAVDGSVDTRPQLRRAVDHFTITTTDKMVQRTVGFGKQIADLHFGFGRELPDGVANAARRCIVSFAETRGEDEEIFHMTENVYCDRVQFRRVR